MPLNFHGHILIGSAKQLMIPLGAESGLPWTSTILGEMEIDPKLARWCYYRLNLNPVDGIGSAESVLLRTAVWRFIEALYSNWELVVTHLPKKTVEAAIDEFHQMAKISHEYPVMLWEYFRGDSQGTWVPNALAKLPSLESITEFYQLPHMRAMFLNMRQQDFCDDYDRDAEKAYRRALAERNKRLNRAARQQGRKK